MLDEPPIQKESRRAIPFGLCPVNFGESIEILHHKVFDEGWAEILVGVARVDVAEMELDRRTTQRAQK